MNTFTPYIVGSTCILKGGDRADHRMTELNVEIASSAHYTKLAASKLRSIEPGRAELDGGSPGRQETGGRYSHDIRENRDWHDSDQRACVKARSRTSLNKSTERWRLR
jgi:hypothetical protein